MSDFFVELSPRSLEMLEQTERRRSVETGTVLFLKGDEGTHVYRLRTGSIRLYQSEEGGREATVRLIEPMELFAEVVLFERDTYPVSAIAMADSEISTYPRARVLSLLEDQAFRNDFIRSLAGKLRFLSAEVAAMSALDLETRFARFLEGRYGRAEVINLTMSKQDVAAALSVRPETLSRAIRKLDQAGLLTWKSRTIRIEPEFWADR